jgi:hypothetical protein
VRLLYIFAFANASTYDLGRWILYFLDVVLLTNTTMLLPYLNPRIMTCKIISFKPVHLQGFQFIEDCSKKDDESHVVH